MVYFLLPLAALLLVVHAHSAPDSWSNQPIWRAVQFWFSVLYSITNLLHLIADVRIPDSRADQVALMVVLTIIGLLINLESWLWWQV
jgi:hypothetical protein